MPYVSKEQIDRAKQMDLLTYLQNYEPQELVRFSGDVFTTRTHDSLKISNGKWNWWSHGIGGRSALDYLIKVRGMTLPEAVLLIDGQADIAPPVPPQKSLAVEPKELHLPEKNQNNKRVIAYLAGRGINLDIIDYCIRTNRLYESKDYHNAVFVGFDRKGVSRYGVRRGTSGQRFIGDVTGSDKHYSFSISARDESDTLHLFECAIDLLSFCTLELLAGRDWRKENCLSLAGIYKPKNTIEDSTPPAALMQYLQDFPHIKNIVLHLDNDVPGRLAAKTIQLILPSEYTVKNMPPKRGKDENDYLKCFLKQQKPQMIERD